MTCACGGPGGVPGIIWAAGVLRPCPAARGRRGSAVCGACGRPHSVLTCRSTPSAQRPVCFSSVALSSAVRGRCLVLGSAFPAALSESPGFFAPLGEGTLRAEAYASVRFPVASRPSWEALLGTRKTRTRYRPRGFRDGAAAARPVRRWGTVGRMWSRGNAPRLRDAGRRERRAHAPTVHIPLELVAIVSAGGMGGVKLAYGPPTQRFDPAFRNGASARSRRRLLQAVGVPEAAFTARPCLTPPAGRARHEAGRSDQGVGDQGACYAEAAPGGVDPGPSGPRAAHGAPLGRSSHRPLHSFV